MGIWLPQGQLWATEVEAASPTQMFINAYLLMRPQIQRESRNNAVSQEPPKHISMIRALKLFILRVTN